MFCLCRAVFKAKELLSFYGKYAHIKNSLFVTAHLKRLIILPQKF